MKSVPSPEKPAVPTFTPERIKALSPMARQIAALLEDAGYIVITTQEPAA